MTVIILYMVVKLSRNYNGSYALMCLAAFLAKIKPPAKRAAPKKAIADERSRRGGKAPSRRELSPEVTEGERVTIKAI